MATSRAQLYAEVWAEPMTTVANRYNVSSSFLARVCERLNVPRPPRGFWAQRAVGIKLEQPPLQAAEPGAELEWVRDGSEPQRQPMSATSPRPKHAKRDRPDTHPLLRGAVEHFAHARESRDNHYVRPYKRNIVDVFVSPEALHRALDTANALFLALEDAGQGVTLAPSGDRDRYAPAQLREGKNPDDDKYYYYHATGKWCPTRPTVTLVGDVTIGLSLFEVSEEAEAEYDSKQSKYVRINTTSLSKARGRHAPAASPGDWTRKHWMPSGRLGLHAYAAHDGVQWNRHWYETQLGAFASLYREIAKDLEHAAKAIVKLIAEADRKREIAHREWEARQAQWNKEQEEERRMREAQARQEEAIRREEEFAASIGRWRLAQDVREYVSAVHALVNEAHVEITQGGPLERELKWALDYANRVDPLRQLREDIAALKRHHSTDCPKCQEAHTDSDDSDDSEPQ
jgi:hypothetical protein